MIDGQLDHYHRVVSTDLDSVFYCAKAAGEIWRRQYLTGVNTMGEKLDNYRYGSFVATASMSGHIANIPQLQSAVSRLITNLVSVITPPTSSPSSQQRPSPHPRHPLTVTPTTVQRRQSGRNPPLQIPLRRMGTLRPR